MRRSRSIARLALAALAIGACAVASAAWLRARDAGHRADALAGELASLTARLADESALRSTLAAETARLREALPVAPPGEVGASQRTPSGQADVPVAGAAADVPASDPVAATAAAEPQSVDVERVVAAGFRREDVERFKARADQIALARVYLRDRATREGWLDSPDFREQTAALDAEQAGLRGEFDEQLYDWMLYTSGRPNRVGVAEVLAGSAAASVGLARGDVIMRYDDQLMLSVQDLLSATHDGRAGESVAVEVQREGESTPLRLFLPRGPLGVRIAPVAVEPGAHG